MNISTNLENVNQEIRSAELEYQRVPHSVKLLAVSKKQNIEKINSAIAAGQFAFGENYLQEALEKILAINNDKVEWHFIGAIQSNKTKKIAEHFQWVQTVSDFKMAERLNAQRPEHLPRLNVCLQVNSSLDPNKSGALPHQIVELATQCVQLPRLHIRGLMAVPTEKKNFTEQRQECQKVATIWQLLREKGFQFDTLSLGMSNDLVAAIAEGSTLVRIGTKIFGNRV